MNVCIGSCSICGGQVMVWEGPWMSVAPPPPPTCSQCGAVAAASRPVIPMIPAGHYYPTTRTFTYTVSTAPHPADRDLDAEWNKALREHNLMDDTFWQHFVNK